MAKTIRLAIVVVPFGRHYRAACQLAGKPVYSSAQPDEASAVRALFLAMGQNGPFAEEVSLLLDLEVMGEGSMSALLQEASEGHEMKRGGQ